MVPFALLPGQGFVIHVSALATHTKDMIRHAGVSLLVTASLADGHSPLALPRASIHGEASTLEPDSAQHALARAAYLDRLPEAEGLFSFADFSLFLIAPRAIRYVAGFGRAMSLTGDALRTVLGDPP